MDVLYAEKNSLINHLVSVKLYKDTILRILIEFYSSNQNVHSNNIFHL